MNADPWNDLVAHLAPDLPTVADVERSLDAELHEPPTITGAVWEESPDLQDLVREADSWANLRPDDPEAVAHRRRHGGDGGDEEGTS